MTDQSSPTFTVSPSDYDAVIFDLDGVITDTARIHSIAWKKLFDDYLEQRAARFGEQHEPFDPNVDYRQYVDGKPRYQGVKSFLASRGVEIPFGEPQDSPDQETVCGLGNKKNPMFLEGLKTYGADVYQSSVDFIHQLHEQGIRTSIVSSSKNCATILDVAGLTHLFEVKVDGLDGERMGLKGKPEPDTFLEAARVMGVDPTRSIIVEDAISGVQAGQKGNFGFVLGIDRTGHPDDLSENGADVVVKDLVEVAVSQADSSALPSAMGKFADFTQQLKGKHLALFLDYDGTLTPIVERPEWAVMAESMRDTIRTLSELCTVAIISGRDLRDVQKLVQMEELFFAGSHGFDIEGPAGKKVENQQDLNFIPLLDGAEKRLREHLTGIEGSLVERKKFSIAVHYRLVSDEQIAAVEKVVDDLIAAEPKIKKTYGKKVFDLQPNIDWNKGKAVHWLLKALGLDRPDVLPVFMGDDVTDEDAFKALRTEGVGIVVMEEPRPSAAHYYLRDPAEVEHFFARLIPVLKENA
ncbi:MAG: trehalose-phosphatase [Candidatus Competibacteraceae bacterium]|jgi:alpha,alpha-trehalase|nr:trehalose-phosphatase [Candidatus Competibacteraceae bacterium]